MKVIVSESGFYAGTWYEKGPRAVEMPARVARPFLPPYGHQLVDPAASATKPSDKSTAKSGEKKAD